MTDIVQRLRLVDPNQVLLGAPPNDTFYLQAGLICHEAAADIERLREAVNKFGRHLNDCGAMVGGYQCTCGFNQQGVKP